MSKAYLNANLLGLLLVLLTLGSASAVVTSGPKLTLEPSQHNELYTMLYALPDSSTEYFMGGMDVR